LSAVRAVRRELVPPEPAHLAGPGGARCGRRRAAAGRPAARGGGLGRDPGERRLDRPPGGRLTMAAILELRDLSKSFGALPVIQKVNLDIMQGERHALIGPNGAGKSTMFNLISGMFPPTGGEVRLRGERISGLSPH